MKPQRKKKKIQKEKPGYDPFVNPFSLEIYKSIAANRRNEFLTNEPFPNIVIDNFLPFDIAEWLNETFPFLQDEHGFEVQKEGNSNKKFRPTKLPYYLKTAYDIFTSVDCVAFLSELTSEPELRSDPTYAGGGYYQIAPGGYLKIHADFNVHPDFDWIRAINVLYFLNKGWEEDWNGNIDLWDTKLTRCVRSISPVFNRAVIFKTSSESFHGHPIPLSCPPGRNRNALSFYYYTGKAPSDMKRHSTLYMKT